MAKSVLVLLPEGKLFDQVLADAITPVIGEIGGRVERPCLELTKAGNETRLCELIKSADLVIADVTAKSPHVLFGLGLAKAFEREVLLLAQHLEDFPFDRKAHPVIGYAGDYRFLRGELSSFLTFGKENRQPQAAEANARDRFIESFGDILASHGYEHRGEIRLENPTTYVLLNQEMELALVQELARRARELGVRLKLM